MQYGCTLARLGRGINAKRKLIAVLVDDPRSANVHPLGLIIEGSKSSRNRTKIKCR